MNHHTFRGTAVAAAAVVVGCAAGCRDIADTAGTPLDAAAERSGVLTGVIRSEPRSFNKFANRDLFTEVYSLLADARLVRVNRQTDEVEPWLASSWTPGADGRSWDLHLRRDVRFSDGTLLTASDVLFAFEAVYDPRTASPLADALKVGGKPLTVTAPDPFTVHVVFPAPFAPGLRLLDHLPVLPRHRLEKARDAGTLATAWGPSTPPSEIAGLGPFVLSAYTPGQRVEFLRNPHYWRRDERGRQLPLVEKLSFEIVLDQNAELLRLQSGDIDVTTSEMRPDDYRQLQRAAASGRVRVEDLGTSLDADALWFHLGRPRHSGDPRLPWLRDDRFRHAISRAVDRREFADVAFFGAATPQFGPVNRGNRRWFSDTVAAPAYDPAAARALLSGLGLKDRDADGTLEDERGNKVRFSILIVKGNTAAERGASHLASELGKLGIQVDIAALNAGAVVERILSGDYDAAYYRILASDPDPALNLDFWLSSGGAHVWNIGQATPATTWERDIDSLMLRQAASNDPAERKRLFDQVQAIFAEHEPAIYFAAPHTLIATSTRLANATPAIFRPQILWNPDPLAIAPTRGRISGF